MKAVILELRNGQAAVLDRDGIVRLIPDQGFAIGEILDLPSALLPERKKAAQGHRVTVIRKRMRRRTLLAAACLSLAVFAGGISAIAMPVATVTVDSEPSMEYNLNIFGNVIRVTAYNDAAQELSDELTRYVRGQNISNAVQITLDVFSENGYLAQDGLSVAVSVQASPGRQEAVENDVNKGLDLWKESRLTQEEAESFETETVVVSPELRDEARMEGVTPGRIVMDNYVPEPRQPEALPQAPAERTEGMAPPDNTLPEDQGESRPSGTETPGSFQDSGEFPDKDMNSQMVPAFEQRGEDLPQGVNAAGAAPDAAMPVAEGAFSGEAPPSDQGPGSGPDGQMNPPRTDNPAPGPNTGF